MSALIGVDRNTLWRRRWLDDLAGCLQSNGMAESFVNTFKRDYVARMDLSDARTVLA